MTKTHSLVKTDLRSGEKLWLDLSWLPCHTDPMLIYKIFRASEWAELQTKGETLGAPIDIADGFIHFSTAAQCRETAAKHFAGEAELMLLGCETLPMGADLKWEVSRNDDLFPHLYRKLKLTDVTWSAPLPLVEDTHQFPDHMT